MDNKRWVNLSLKYNTLKIIEKSLFQQNIENFLKLTQHKHICYLPLVMSDIESHDYVITKFNLFSKIKKFK